MPRKPKAPPAMVIQPMRRSPFSASTSAMPATGYGLKASILRKPSRRARFVASSSASAVPNSASRPRMRSAMSRLRFLAGEHFLVLEDRDRWQEANEQQVRRHEQPEHPDEGAPVPEGRRVMAEGRGQEVFVEAGDQDHV